jgi:hypothetical protein
VEEILMNSAVADPLAGVFKPDPRAVLLRDTMVLEDLRLDEAASKDGKVVMEGIFAKCGIPTKNKRVYSEGLWKKNIARLNERMGQKAVYGELDHPSDGKTLLQRVSHYLTGLRIVGETVVGRLELLPDKFGTPAAQAHSIISSGGKIGVSSRGFGLTETDRHGNTVVKEDSYRLDTFDLVADPAVDDAYPEVCYEDVYGGGATMSDTVTLESLKKDHPDLVDAIEGAARTEVDEVAGRAADAIEKLKAENADLRSRLASVEGDAGDLRERMATEVAAAIERHTAEITERVKSDLMSDPDVALAKRLVSEDIPALLRPLVRMGGEPGDADKELADTKLSLRQAESDVQALTGKVTELAVAYRVATTLEFDPHADTIREMLGDLSKIDSPDDATVRIEAIRKTLRDKGMYEGEIASWNDLDDVVGRAADAIDLLKRENAELEGRVASMEADMNEGQAKVDAGALAEAKAKVANLVRENADLSLRLRVEEMISHRRDREAIRDRLIECGSVGAAEAMFESLAEYGDGADDDAGGAGFVMERVRARLRSRSRAAREDEMQEEGGRPSVGAGAAGKRTGSRSGGGDTSLLESDLRRAGLDLDDVMVQPPAGDGK